MDRFFVIEQKNRNIFVWFFAFKISNNESGAIIFNLKPNRPEWNIQFVTFFFEFKNMWKLCGYL